jgi:hypothetical protein
VLHYALKEIPGSSEIARGLAAALSSQHHDILTSPLDVCRISGMRTTLDIDDDLLRAAKSLARAQGKSLGRVLSGLARRGLEPRKGVTARRGFPVFTVSREAPPLTPEIVRKAEEEG